MTVIHILSGLGGGGAEHMVLELSKQLQQQGTKVVVVSISPVNMIAHKFDAGGIENISLGIRGVKDILPGLQRLRRLLLQHPKRVVHAHMFHAGMFAVLTKILGTTTPMVFTLHTNHVKQAARKAMLFLTKGMRRADVIFSAGSGQWYQKRGAVPIFNGIDISRFNLPRQLPETFTCLFLGRLEEPKNPLYLIDLVNHLKHRYRFKIQVAGDGSLREELEKQIRWNQLDDYFELLGFRNDIPELLSQVHCLIMPSLWEGMPISVLEAGAAGTPLIVTPVGSIPAILNKRNAYVVQLDNFHRELEQVMNDYPAALERAAVWKKQVAADFDITAVSGKHLALYEQVLA